MDAAILSKAKKIIRKKKELEDVAKAEEVYRQTCVIAGICPICGEKLVEEKRVTKHNTSVLFLSGSYTVTEHFLVCNTASSNHHFEYRTGYYDDIDDGAGS